MLGVREFPAGAKFCIPNRRRTSGVPLPTASGLKRINVVSLDTARWVRERKALVNGFVPLCRACEMTQIECYRGRAVGKASTATLTQVHGY